LSAAKRSEFSRAPLRVSTARAPRVAGRDHRGRLFLVTFFGEAKKVTRPPGRNPGLSPRQCSRIASPGKARAALSVLKFRYIGKRQRQKQLLLRSDALPLVTQHHCTVVMTRPGVRPGGRPTFFASPKKDRQKKATPMIAPRCAGSPCRRRLKRGAAKLATLRCAQTDAAPYPLQASPSRRAQRGVER
jgi:hypothetical protein